MLQLQTSPTFFKTPLNYLILLSNFDYWTISHFGIFNILIYMNYFSRNYSFPTKFCPKLSHISLPFRGGLNFQSTINQQPKTSDCDRARYSIPGFGRSKKPRIVTVRGTDGTILR